MKRLLIFMLLLLIVGCSHNARKILPPLYEEYYPFIVGVRSYESESSMNIDSMLTGILLASHFAAGVIEEPFEDSMVDIVLVIESMNTTKRRSGFLPVRFTVEGELILKLAHPDGSMLNRYSAQARVEQSSLNPFCQRGGENVLLAELLTSVIDEMDEDFQKEPPEIIHEAFKDEKSFEAETRLTYPTLTHFSRHGVHANAHIKGLVPISEVQLNVFDMGGDSVLSQQLFFEKVNLINGEREWFYQLDMGNVGFAPGKALSYEMISIDAMGKRDKVSAGTLQAISNRIYNLKKAEVIAHGTIITAFGGLMIVMMMYAI